MARPKSFLVRALLLYLVLLPALGIRAEAQGASRAPERSETPRPFDPPAPDRGVRFTPTARSLTVRSLNGFVTDTTTGFFSHLGHSHDGGVITIASPWGETLETRFWLTPHGVSFEYDDDLVVRYRLDKDGNIQEIEAESPYRAATMAVGNRAYLVQQGRMELSSFDMSAYEVIEEAIRANHSESFIDGLRETQGIMEAGCATSVILCAACILAWAASVPALAAACVVGGVPTFGLACLGAILAHEATTIACAATCVEMVYSCRGRPQGEVIPDGCEPRD